MDNSVNSFASQLLSYSNDDAMVNLDRIFGLLNQELLHNHTIRLLDHKLYNDNKDQTVIIHCEQLDDTVNKTAQALANLSLTVFIIQHKQIWVNRQVEPFRQDTKYVIRDFTQIPTFKPMLNLYMNPEYRSNIRFVTSLVDLKETRHHTKSIDKYLEHFSWLLSCNLELYVFTSGNLFDRLKDMISDMSNSGKVRLFKHELEDCKFYDRFRSVSLPESDKDTKNYMTLINDKTNMVCKAINSAEHDANDLWCWIDFGIFHIANDKESVRSSLNDLSLSSIPCKLLASMEHTRIIAPGIYDRLETSDGSDSLESLMTKIADNVWWRFCGGLFIGTSRDIKDMDHKHEQACIELLETNTKMFEVNVWAYMESKGWEVSWYKADHNESMITGLDLYDMIKA